MLYVFFRVCLRILFRLLYRVRVEGVHHIPGDGPVILCSNHISLLDPPLVGTYLTRKVRYMAKAELFGIPVFSHILRHIGAFPVKRGGISKESIRLAIDILKQGEMLCIFPEGTRSAAMAMGKKGAASFAMKSGATVIPAAIIGQYKLFQPMKIVYGPAVDLDAYREEVTSENLELATDKIMNAIRGLLDKH